MKATKANIGRVLDRPDAGIRFYLFYGADEGQSRSHGERLLKALGAVKYAVSANDIRADPAALADEAGAISLFGETRLIWIEPAGDEIEAGVAALLAAAACDSPVVAIAGPLRKTSALLKLAESSALALVYVSYTPDGEDAEAMADQLARSEGLRLEPGVAARLATACDNDRRLIGQELAKLALYADASPEQPRALGQDALDAVAAGSEGDTLRLADLALAGELRDLSEELSRTPALGGEAIPILRSLQRRLLMLAPMRARIDRGERFADVMASGGRPLFWKDKPLIGRLLETWDSVGLARIADRAGSLERSLMRADSPPPAEALGEELIAIARAAARRR